MNTILVAAGLLGMASAKMCQNMTIPVEIEARQGVFNVPPITNNVEVTNFVQNFTSITNGTNYTQEVLTGYQTVTGTYSISAKFCMPDSGLGNNPAVQVLTHGIGFDKTYWDLSYNNFNYSYENIATAAGYCTLSIDRLGVGNSSHADPYQVIQAPAEVSALYQINTMLRNGTLPNITHSFGKGKIINVGHSFGSQQSYQLANMYPDATDALILTGFSLNNSFVNLGTFNAKLARTNQPLRFGNPALTPETLQTLLATPNATAVLNMLSTLAASANISSTSLSDLLMTTSLLDLISGWNVTGQGSPLNYPDGYITWSDVTANIFNFLYTANVDPTIIGLSESTKQPFTIGEALTLGGAPAISPFKGPVHILTGRQDALYCGGDCLNTGMPDVTSIPEAAGMYFPSSSNFSVSIPEGVGHAITVHYPAQAAYMKVQDWLEAQGIASM